jgi:hypothetical protein
MKSMEVDGVSAGNNDRKYAATTPAAPQQALTVVHLVATAVAAVAITLVIVLPILFASLPPAEPDGIELKAHMMAVGNQMQRAFGLGNREDYVQWLADDFRMVIPDYGVDVVGKDAAWALRTGMGDMAPQIVSGGTHTFPEPHKMFMLTTVWNDAANLFTGSVFQMSMCNFTFDETNTYVVRYDQSNFYRNL